MPNCPHCRQYIEPERGITRWYKPGGSRFSTRTGISMRRLYNYLCYSAGKRLSWEEFEREQRVWWRNPFTYDIQPPTPKTPYERLGLSGPRIPIKRRKDVLGRRITRLMDKRWKREGTVPAGSD